MNEEQGIKKGTVITVIVVLLLIVGGTWGYVKYSNKTDDVSGIVAGDDVAAMDITARHQFKDGKHIVAGELNLPTPCYVLATNALVAESMPEQVTLEFTATTQGEMCAQVITKERFKIEFTASEGATIKATWNGQPANLNLIPAGADEDLSNFEIFIKG